jgi:hypothetical protein
MQNSQDFHLPIATLTMGNENLSGELGSPRELVTVSQKCRLAPTINQEKTLRKYIARSSVRGVLDGEQKGKKSGGMGNVNTVNAVLETQNLRCVQKYRGLLQCVVGSVSVKNRQ